MKAVVFAYNNFGCIGLEALIRHGFDVAAVVTHKDDPDEKIYFGSVAAIAAVNGIPVYTPDTTKTPEFIGLIKRLKPDIIFSFYYRKMIADEILAFVKGNAYNLHGALLPKYRGRCPINWVFVNGETETGVTLHKMTDVPDGGDIAGQKKLKILPGDDVKSILPKINNVAMEVLDEQLPLIKTGKVKLTRQNEKQATTFSGRKSEDGLIDWTNAAEKIHNLVRAVTDPFPGAYTFFGLTKVMIWKSELSDMKAGKNTKPGTVLSTNPFTVSTGLGALTIISGQVDNKPPVSGTQLATEIGVMKDCKFNQPYTRRKGKTKVLILGVNGFIGCALTERLLADGNYEVYGMDLSSEKLGDLVKAPGFTFCEGDISIQRTWVEYHVRKCDVVLPLVAIATPQTYVKDPLRVFELDFEENLRIVRHCVKYNKRVIFPSTSEVYGMCQDPYFDEETSPLITGPISKNRWIYSCSKQLLDRVIWAYGMQKGLKFSLFRPFNWVGPRLDSLDSARLGSSRVLTIFALNLVEGTPIRLVDGGDQKRCFTDLSDGIEGLFRIIENKDGKADGRIFNLGSPENEASIRELAEVMVSLFEDHPERYRFPATPKILEVSSKEYYGKGYQDVVHRRPSIQNAKKYLGWEPKVGLNDAISNALNFFIDEHIQSLKKK